jgi:site-specific recombinase XerD
MRLPRKQRTHYLSPYRRHAPLCREPQNELRRCECPLWCQGRVHGKYVREALHTRSLGEAEKIIERRLYPPDDDPGGLRLVPDEGALTIADAIEQFLSVKKDKSTHTQDIYATAIAHFEAYAKSQRVLALRDVRSELIERYFDQHRKQWRKASTRYARLTQLRVFFNYCVKKDWLRKSPAQHVENVERPSGYARRAYSKAEIAAILNAAERLPPPERDRGRALILLLLYSGMRISDATWAARHALRPDGVLDYRVIKTSKRIGLAPELQPVAVDALRKLPDSRVFFFQPDRDDDYHDALHALYNGEHFEKHLAPGIYDAALREAATLVYKVLALARVKGGCHRFRDTFALTLLAAEVDVFTVSQMLGHSDVRITQKHYLNLIPGYIERMAQATRKLNYAA